MLIPELIAFYSPDTGVSLELPVGFEQAPVTTGARYRLTADDDVTPIAWLDVTLISGADADAARAADDLVTAVKQAAAQVISQGNGTVDDCRVLTVVVRPGDSLPGLVLHYSVAITPGSLRTFAAVAPWAERDRWLPVFDRAVASCRFLRTANAVPEDGSGYGSLTRLDMGVSLLVPRGWSVIDDEQRIRLRGPEADGVSPTFTLVQGEPEEPGEDWFDNFRRTAVSQTARTASGYEQVAVEDFALSSFVDVTALFYHRDADGRPMSQLQAYLWAGSYRMLVADAAAPRALQDSAFAAFETILRSIRLLPPQVA